jgi:predicted esterase
MDFGAVRQQVFASYGRGEWDDALDLVREARPQFPKRDSILTFWEACLLSLDGKPHAALAVLGEGLDRGLFWDAGILADPDLDAARELEGWVDFERRSVAVIESLDLKRPGTMVRRADDPVGTVIALHGAGDVPEDFFAEWDAATPVEWTLIVPVGDVPVTDIKWAWPYDLSTDSLVESLEQLTLIPPIVMSGYSQGARMAAKVAWNGSVKTSGLILSAPTLAPEAWTESQRSPIPLYAVVGTEDLAYEPLLSTSETLKRDSVPVQLDVRQGLGHVPPEDLNQVIADGLAWIREQTAQPVAETDP